MNIKFILFLIFITLFISKLNNALPKKKLLSLTEKTVKNNHIYECGRKNYRGICQTVVTVGEYCNGVYSDGDRNPVCELGYCCRSNSDGRNKCAECK